MSIPYKENKEGYTIQEFMKLAINFEKQNKVEADSPEEWIWEMERKYWIDYVEHQKEDPVEVEYIADLETDVYGSGFPKEGNDPYLNHPWNLNNIRRAKGSFLDFDSCSEVMQKWISGLTVPWIYMGMQYSTFCWHYEDLMLYSLNYMHLGGSKVWYSIPGPERKRFE